MTQIDITMTAVLRPEILRRTLETITENVCYKKPERFRLILNVDPVGENIKPKVIVKVARKFFPNLVYQVAKEPCFPKAVKWIWSKSSAPYVLHWEDDCKILRRIDIDDMIRILEKYEDLSSLRLFKMETPKTKKLKVFSCLWLYNEDGFYLANDWKAQFGLNPILVKRAFIDEAVLRMVDNYNPEKQFRYSQEYMRPLIRKWKYGLYTKPGEPRLIDGRQGTEWRKELGLDKPKNKTFIRWEKKDDKSTKHNKRRFQTWQKFQDWIFLHHRRRCSSR